MGRRATPPQFCDFEYQLPPAETLLRCSIVHASWLQGLEGQLDTAHLGYLHRSSFRRLPHPTLHLLERAGPPTFELVERPYGFREAALRELPDGSVYARIRELVLPYHSFIPDSHGHPRLVVMTVPIDDEWSAHWYYYVSLFGPIPAWFRDMAFDGTHPDDDDFTRDRGGRADNWHQDRQAMKQGHWSGITRSFHYEDAAIEESMGPIVDRTKEHLGSSDVVLIRTRRMLLSALKEHAEGKLPFGLDRELDYRRIRGLAIRLPGGTDWKSLDIQAPPAFELDDATA
jgi:phthalate 4,5-dioxygenase oxygenase subunit